MENPLFEVVLCAIEGGMKRLDHHIEEAIASGEDERADVQAVVDLANAKVVVESALKRAELQRNN